MVYVRSKQVKGHTYYYLVRSVREGDKVRQEMVQYLGSKKPTYWEVMKLKKDCDKKNTAKEKAKKEVSERMEKETQERIKKETQESMKKEAGEKISATKNS